MRSKLLILLLGFYVSVTAQQTGLQSLAQLKESPAGSKIIKYIGSVNDGEELLDGWVTKLFAPKLIEKMSVEKLLDIVTETRKTDGQLHIYKANRSAMFKYRLKVNGLKSGEWFDMVFTFEEGEPYRITGITMDSTDKGTKADKPIFPKM